MKRFAFAAGLFASVACFSLQAQSSDLLATIPFEFRVGNTVMPAGQYRVQQASSVLSIRKQDGEPKGAMLLTSPASRKAKSEQKTLEFNRYGDVYFLTHVWDSGSGRAVPKSAMEKELISRAGQVQTAGINLRSK
jgi:hypothetical protein